MGVWWLARDGKMTQFVASQGQELVFLAEYSTDDNLKSSYLRTVRRHMYAEIRD